MVELKIENKGVVYNPVVLEGITWETERQGAPGSLKFDIAKVGNIDVTEGNLVRLIVGGVNVFLGFIFSKKRSKENIISIVAYDQLRYFKNKDTYVFENKTAGGIVKAIVEDFQLQWGVIENTGYWIPSLVQENTTLFDMVQSAVDLTVTRKGEMYVLYDDFGKLCFRNIGNMKVDYIITEEVAEDFSYSSSIDSNTYNRIRLFNKDEEDISKRVTEKRSDESIKNWGVLQYFEVVEKDVNAKDMAETLLALYNRKTRSLSFSGCFGDLRVRAGSMIVVKLNLGDVVLSNYMLVEKCKHIFNESEHFMDLTVRGGDFSA